ncbi:MAG: heme o synthase [Armatimonadetes bacterium]|nr:heme o synthase [Armatimonadota bacterium]MDW8154364.1 heme o synthase [Armatimonadota bacterium]
MTRVQRLSVSALGVAVLVAVLGAILLEVPRSCTGWPLCGGRVLPPAGGLELVEWIHRLLAAHLVLLGLILWWVTRRESRVLQGLFFATFLVVLVEAGVGARIALGGSSGSWSTVHRVLGMGAVFLLGVACVAAFASSPSGWDPRSGGPVAVLGLGVLGLAAGVDSRVVGVCAILIGLALRGRFAGSAVGLLGSGVAALGAGLVGAHALGMPGLRTAAVGAVASIGVVGALGVAAGMSGFGLGTSARREGTGEVRAYLELSKPRIVVLLLVTTACATFAAAGRDLPWEVLLATVVGGALSAAGANALNQVLDRDVDAVMDRTRHRPLVTGRVDVPNALAFGVLLGLASFGVLAVSVNLLAATLAALGYLFYVLVYSVWLKRSTDQNIVIGGAAGALPPLVGWAAVTDRVDLLALGMFLVVFLWTPPHFWALALVRREDYARAGIPMLPVVRGEARTRREILVYTALLVAATLGMAGLGATGPLYGASASLLGLLLLRGAWRLYRQRTPQAAWSLFRFSNAYLALLFTALVVDRILFPNVG